MSVEKKEDEDCLETKEKEESEEGPGYMRWKVPDNPENLVEEEKTFQKKLKDFLDLKREFEITSKKLEDKKGDSKTFIYER